MAASLFIGGFLNGIISQLWGDGDDEDYDQFIPDYKKEYKELFLQILLERMDSILLTLWVRFLLGCWKKFFRGC